MAELSAQAQKIFSEFGSEPDVTADQARNLLSIVNASPALVDQVNAAVAKGHVARIVPLTNPNAGGEYDAQNHAIRLPLARLTPVSPGQLPSTTNMGEVTYALGHELQHGFNAEATKRALKQFDSDVGNISRGSGVRDYTEPLATLLAQNRRDEAGAQIAGWNAVVSRVLASKPNATRWRISTKNSRGAWQISWTVAAGLWPSH